ncbi:Panacea domain-containing protein [Roseateles sp. So40a]|uniref:Panacea domain-containing protein n=1 Tax=Roseateles sp. So40a TaxID=3400226 RepID=UPI003A84B9A1
MADIDDVADYLIVKLWEAGERPSVHRLHKLLYYVQGWHLALHDRPLFPERFQAWVHGPICKPLFERFSADRSLYGVVEPKDARPSFTFEVLSFEERQHVDRVLNDYAIYPTFQLMWMTRQERPCLKARGPLALGDRCERELDECEMRAYFIEEQGVEHEDRRTEARS